MRCFSLDPSPDPALLASLDALPSFHPRLTAIRIYVSILANEGAGFQAPLSYSRTDV